MSKPGPDKNDNPAHATKKCPYCYTHLSLDAKICFSCKRKVGKVEKHGMAKIPVDWISYIVCLIAWLGFFLYIWWAFF